MKPVLVVTNHVPPDRVGAFAALHAREGIELALFGGRSHHATAGTDDPGVPHRHVSQRDVHGLAASGGYRAVICGTAGRAALPAAFAGARRARVPFVLWTALWAHPRSAAFALAGTPLLRALYRQADAIATYGPHVSDFVRARGARRVAVAPQAVDGSFWTRPDRDPARSVPYTAISVGRAARYKGEWVLRDAWRASGLEALAALVLVGAGSGETRTRTGGAVTGPGVHAVGRRPPEEVRNFYAASDVLVMAAVPTRTFREPWGLVANEAMHMGLPVIATDAVGAAAGGLVRHERNGLVVRAGDPVALGAALRRLHDDAPLRERLAAAARRDVAPYTFEAWAAGMSRALHLAEGRR